MFEENFKTTQELLNKGDYHTLIRILENTIFKIVKWFTFCSQ